MKAIWNNVVIAESDNTLIIEGNNYFPKNSLKMEFFKESTTSTHCPWKGDASYYSLDINGQKNEDAAWYYPHPSQLASNIKNHVAFWKGVEVVD